MVAYLKRVPSGIAGAITRIDETNVEPGFLAASGAPTAYGTPVKVSSGKFALMGAGSAAADFYGVLARYAPATSGTLAASFSDGAPNDDYAQGIVVRGYVNVVCTVGTPARGGTVYVRVVADTGKAPGDFEATADGANSVALTGVTWSVDGKDANNITEIRIAR